MMERTLMAVAALAAIAAAAVAGVFSAFFALFAFLEPHVGTAGAAAIIAGCSAVVIALAGFVAARKAKGDRKAVAAEIPDASLVEIILGVVRDRPILSAGAAVAAGIYALRNPQLVAAVIRAFMDKPADRN
ncbi:MAG: hypothetical protein Q7T19_16385 [Caulobacter sp.]|nr:hypothetical protein [Caulobacter sp.]